MNMYAVLLPLHFYFGLSAVGHISMVQRFDHKSNDNKNKWNQHHQMVGIKERGCFASACRKMSPTSSSWPSTGCDKLTIHHPMWIFMGKHWTNFRIMMLLYGTYDVRKHDTGWPAINGIITCLCVCVCMFFIYLFDYVLCGYGYRLTFGTEL